MNKELEAIARKIAWEVMGIRDPRLSEGVVEFATRFLAAVQAQQEPVAWMVDGMRDYADRKWLYYKEEWPKAHAEHGDNVTPLFAYPPAIPDGMALVPNIDTTIMTPQELSIIRDLRHRGFAIICWTPEEIGGANPRKVEDREVELGWDIISDLGGPYAGGGPDD